ncbi:MAG: hypothetical protein ACOC2F_08165 [Bacteroidota bacterium]
MIGENGARFGVDSVLRTTQEQAILLELVKYKIYTKTFHQFSPNGNNSFKINILTLVKNSSNMVKIGEKLLANIVQIILVVQPFKSDRMRYLRIFASAKLLHALSWLALQEIG